MPIHARKRCEIALDTAGWTGRGGRYAIEIVGGSKRIEITGR